MYQHATRHPHPLRSFRFWFLVLGCVAAATAWRMGWLPSRPAQLAGSREVDLTAPPTDEPSGQTGETTVDPRAQALDAQAAAAQSEPAASGTPEVAHAEPSPVTTAEFQTSAAPATAASSANPFGPAHPEFVPADTFAHHPDTPPQTRTQRFPADPSMIQQVGAVEAEPPVNAAVILQGSAPPIFPEPQALPHVDWDAIDRMIDAGQDVEAHRMLSSLYWERLDLRDQLRSRIEQTAQRIYFQPQPHYIDPYVVQPGDLLQSIARTYNVSWQYIAKLNRTDPIKIRPGQPLKVIQGPFGVVIDLRRFEATVHAHGYFVARFPIGIGKDGATPVGDFTVEDKLEDPTYYGPDGVIANTDPQNPLGEFWLSIGGGYGIHGTIDESSIGRAESRGCIRLRKQDIADLYDLMTVGSPVVIRR